MPGVLRDLGRLATQVDAVCALADRFLQKRMAGEEAVGDASVVKNAYSAACAPGPILACALGGMAAQYRAADHLRRSQHRQLDGRFHEFLRLDHRRGQRGSAAQYHRRTDAGHAARAEGVAALIEIAELRDAVAQGVSRRCADAAARCGLAAGGRTGLADDIAARGPRRAGSGARSGGGSAFRAGPHLADIPAGLGAAGAADVSPRRRAGGQGRLDRAHLRRRICAAEHASRFSGSGTQMAR